MVYFFFHTLKFHASLKFSFFSYIKGKQIYLLSTFFHFHYEWNNNTILPLINKCMSFEMGWIFFQFNSIQFAVWYWGISLLCLMNFERDNHFFLIHSNETSHDKRLFLFMTIIILPTIKEYFQQWLYCRLPSFNTFSSSNNLSRQSLSPLIPSSPF